MTFICAHAGEELDHWKCAGNLNSTPLWPGRVKLSVVIFSGQEGRLDGFFRVSFFQFFFTSMGDGINRVINVGAWTMDGLYKV